MKRLLFSLQSAKRHDSIEKKREGKKEKKCIFLNGFSVTIIAVDNA